MVSPLDQLFDDGAVAQRIRTRLPYLFQLAEVESSRAGRTGMEVGSLRERIIVSLFMWKFGESSVETDMPPTEPEVDAKVLGTPISIKTVTSKAFRGVKLIWTVDAEKAEQYRNDYAARCDIVLAQICWNSTGGLYFLPTKAQQRVFEALGRERYVVLPKAGTNPRGVEISSEALKMAINDESSRRIEIAWNRTQVDYDPYRRWLDYWRED